MKGFSNDKLPLSRAWQNEADTEDGSWPGGIKRKETERLRRPRADKGVKVRVNNTP